ncbi:MAG: hypothetical protein A2086_07860 [Spirochaetes bacterium GWD1_27_9]|nr:MAG: hypothetical protein A2Z98_12370 [Spirochaetes bacterium GWB1_27_13]OHD46001.1 MAG: hypothetical protein A2086_07860 [Spirochaetes bacterium GWD1_27_9]
MLHFGEEPPISFKNGSGTIFFTGCSLRCPFCQNMQISQGNSNKKHYSTKEFIEIIENLINKGAENINFVTPDHFLPHIIEGVTHIKQKHNIPLVYNCSGFQNKYNLEKAVDLMDIFLFDYKFADTELVNYLFKTDKYLTVVENALEFIYKKKGNLTLDQHGKATTGVLVRHLVMPNFIENSIKVINNLFFNFGNTIFLSLMSQYSPLYLKNGFEKINRRLKMREYEEIVSLVNNLGFKNCYIQEFIDHDDEYLPDFKRDGVFKQ